MVCIPVCLIMAPNGARKPPRMSYAVAPDPALFSRPTVVVLDFASLRVRSNELHQKGRGRDSIFCSIAVCRETIIGAPILVWSVPAIEKIGSDIRGGNSFF